MNDVMEKHSTFNAQRSTSKDGCAPIFGRWKLSVGRWTFFFTLILCLHASAQSPAPQPDPLMQLMLTQPSIEVSTNIEINAVFDPPTIGVGEKTTYRITINAISDSIKWPEDIYAPSELSLKQSARGQVLQSAGAALKPMTTINHHVTSATAGEFTIPEFRVKIYGRNVAVPAARLIVSDDIVMTNAPSSRLFVEVSSTNAFCGQPVKVRVLMPSLRGNVIQALQQVQVNGDGILVDQSAVRQSIQQLDFNGRSAPTYIYETTLTPLVAGGINVGAQAFTSGNQFAGAIIIRGNATIPGSGAAPILLDSDSVRLNVEPLPRSGVLPGFSGAIGQFTLDATRLTTNRVAVGDSVKLLVTFRTSGESIRLLAPPSPVVSNWQMFPPLPEGGPVLTATTEGIACSQTFVYTLIPLTNDMTKTPAIPFSCFNPLSKSYVDLTIPPQPITVLAGGATAEAQAFAQSAAATINDKKLQLSSIALSPGRTNSSLLPLQMRESFLLLQLVPLVGFTGLWAWDRRRKFYESHPEILVRRKVKHALSRERIMLRHAVDAGDTARFASGAVNAMRLVCAPHFPAVPRALVGRDVLLLLGESEQRGRTGEVVRRFFAFTDAAQFGATSPGADDLLGLQGELFAVLDKLEAML